MEQRKVSLESLPWQHPTPGVRFKSYERDGLFIPPGIEHGHKARVLTDSVTVVLVEDV